MEEACACENVKPRHSRYLAARELCQVGFEILANHRVDSHQTEHAGLANAALCVVIALRRETRQHQAPRAHRRARTHTHTRQGSAGTWEESQRVQSTRKHFQGQIRQIIPTVQICTLSKYAFLESTGIFLLRLSPKTPRLHYLIQMNHNKHLTLLSNNNVYSSFLNTCFCLQVLSDFKAVLCPVRTKDKNNFELILINSYN